jgi:hypothetical protein
MPAGGGRERRCYERETTPLVTGASPRPRRWRHSSEHLTAPLGLLLAERLGGAQAASVNWVRSGGRIPRRRPPVPTRRTRTGRELR